MDKKTRENLKASYPAEYVTQFMVPLYDSIMAIGQLERRIDAKSGNMNGHALNMIRHGQGILWTIGAFIALRANYETSDKEYSQYSNVLSRTRRAFRRVLDVDKAIKGKALEAAFKTADEDGESWDAIVAEAEDADNFARFVDGPPVENEEGPGSGEAGVPRQTRSVALPEVPQGVNLDSIPAEVESWPDEYKEAYHALDAFLVSAVEGGVIGDGHKVAVLDTFKDGCLHTLARAARDKKGRRKAS